MLSAVLCSAPVDCGAPRAESLCLGPSCGRCLRTCPGDVVGHWDRDWAACDRYRSPHGFAQLTDFFGEVMAEQDAEKQKNMLRSESSFNLWQSILRGSGVVTGCRRCQDVCPIGEDYERFLKDALEDMPEDTSDKRARLEEMEAAEQKGELPGSYDAQKRWIGRLTYAKPEVRK